jgi:hypothetical protein
MIRPLPWFVAVVALCLSARATEAPPYTPPADLAGTWAFTPDPRLPNVLILGDSISLGYTRIVREQLKGKANVYRAMHGHSADNCGETRMGLRKIDGWLGQTKWNVIHFNWGLWDLCYRNPKAKTQGNRDKVDGTLAVPIDEYERNLEQLVTRLEKTGATLIWATTTVVPPDEVGRFVGDDARYNAVAARVMARHHVQTDDLYALSKSFGGSYSKAAGDVHYTPEGYTRLATQVATAVGSAIAGGR